MSVHSVTIFYALLYLLSEVYFLLIFSLGIHAWILNLVHKPLQIDKTIFK